MRSSKSKLFRRSPCEMAAIVIIATGILMLMQPFALALYTYSVPVILAGTGAFLIASHLPE
jgi:hypothetical protein